tara:strand:+ start:13358 stop:13696 length:339 start_codon:yes stop_codon:yes gene_type:complete
MRVKLSYTVEEEDVLSEAAKLVGLSGDDLQQAVTLFNDLQQELRGGDDAPKDVVPNVHKSLEMAEEFRKALLNMDTRLGEVIEIIEGYDDYKRLQQHPPSSPEEVPKKDETD